MCSCSWVGDSLLLAGVAISVHYCLIHWVDRKEPVPIILQDFWKFVKAKVGPPAADVKERIENTDRDDVDSSVKRIIDNDVDSIRQILGESSRAIMRVNVFDEENVL